MFGNKFTQQIVTVACVLLAILLTFICIFTVWKVEPQTVKTSKSENSSQSDGKTEEQTQGNTDSKDVILGVTKDLGTTYINKIIFIGDSTTNHLKARGGIPANQIWTGADGWLNLDSTITLKEIIYPDTNQNMTIAEAAALKKPEYIVITLGADYGVAYLTDEEFETYYIRLIEAIKKASPSTKIMVQTIFPVTAEYSAESKNLTNPNIDKKNAALLQVAIKAGVKYLDTQSVLKGSDNALKPEYDNGDGIHLSEAAYTAILKYISTHAYSD